MTNAEWCARACDLYEVTPGWVIGIILDDSALVYQDFHSGRLGILQNKGNATAMFSGGPTLMASSPEVATFRFTADSAGRITGLQLQEKGHPSRTANRIGFVRSDITFQNGKIKLAGTTISRQPATKRPGMVLIPGGGAQKRDNLQAWWWAYNGFRVLTYDKRGVGGSAGSYSEASILDLAADASAAISTLRSDPLTDKTRIGIIGHSEAGFVAPVVASRMPDLAFVIVPAAPLSPMPQQVVYEIQSAMKCEGFPSEAIANARALRIALNNSVLQNNDWESLQRQIKSAEGEKWFRAARVRPEWKTPSQTMIERARRYLEFDPTEYWKLVRVPVLAIYGETDTQVRLGEVETMFQRVFPPANDGIHTIHVYPKGNHNFLEAETGCDDEVQTLSRIVPGYYQTLITWAIRHVQGMP